jgi:hypothetical protein
MIIPLSNNESAQFAERLRLLSTLQEGWKDGEGKTIDAECIAMAQKIVLQLQKESESKEEPSVHPTPTGGVDLVWSTRVYCTIERCKYGLTCSTSTGGNKPEDILIEDFELWKEDSFPKVITKIGNLLRGENSV